MSTFRELAAWADILHYHFPWPFGDVLHLFNRRVTSKPTVITYHSDVVRQRLLNFFYRPLMQKFLSRVDRIISTSPNYAASSPLLSQQAEKVSVIPIGIDETDLPLPDEDLVAKAHATYGEKFVFFVGVFRYYKGLDFLLEAARQTSANIVIAGSGPDKEKLLKYKNEQGLDNVHFLGRISDVEKVSYLTACRAFVFPSHLPSESFGISLLEAAIYGKPLISCDIGTGTTYVNIAGETGLVIPPADPDSLAEAIDKLVNDVELAQRLGLNARRRFEQLFTGEIMAKQHNQLYRELLEAAGSKN